MSLDDLYTSFQIQDSVVLVGSKETDILVGLLGSKSIILFFEVFVNLLPHKAEYITPTGLCKNGGTNNGLELWLYN